MGIHAISIVLGDNDYSNTFRPLLQTVLRAVEYHGELTKEQAAWMIREGIAFHYRAFQNLSRREEVQGVTEYVTEYLQSVRILFDEEACADTLIDRDDGAWFLDVQTGQITTY